MNILEAKKIVKNFYSSNYHTNDDEFIFTEAMHYLIEETNSPEYMLELGGFYYENKNFELALKYYEMAAQLGSVNAYIGLGYIWYYGRTGVRDYEKAFNNYSKAMELGDITAAYKVADMYKNGYYVENNYNKYKFIIESLYPKIKDEIHLQKPLPEIFTRLARIRADEGRTEEAIDLYLAAKNFLTQRIRYDNFFGNLSIMKWLVKELYSIVDIDYNNLDLYDLYVILEKPCEVHFCCYEEQTVKAAVDENGEFAIEFNGRYFRSVDDFFSKAKLNGDLLTYLSDLIYDIEVRFYGDN